MGSIPILCDCNVQFQYIQSKFHPQPSPHVNNFIKSHVNKSQLQTKKSHHANGPLEIDEWKKKSLYVVF